MQAPPMPIRDGNARRFRRGAQVVGAKYRRTNRHSAASIHRRKHEVRGVPNRCDSPSFYFRQRGSFYELGLKVRDHWWKKVCAANPTEEGSKTTVRTDYMIGEADLTIAKIPHAAFALWR